MDKMADGFSISLETVLVFLGILFIAFCCGFIRSLKRVFSTRGSHHPPPRNILVTHIRIPTTTPHTTVPVENNEGIANVFPAEEVLSPPPYSALSNILPPSYDEAIKQNGNTASEIATPKTDDRY